MRMTNGFTICVGLAISLFTFDVVADDATDAALEKININRGIVALLDLPNGDANYVINLVKGSELTFYFQSENSDQVATVRKAADEAGLLGTRIFADVGSLKTIHLGDNVADSILVASSAKKATTEKELLRALRPQAAAHIGNRKLVKPVPDGIDNWSHPYHGPDNNPQSNDQLARGEFRTQFLATPKFSPMPEQSVIAGGRIYKAMGHIAHKANQNEWLNTLLCINAYNGTILWKRPLPAGFLIHRNTMIATDDALLLGDDISLKIIDGRTGKTRDEIVVPAGIGDGPVWKWMAVKEGVLYALVGSVEVKVDTQKSARRGLGHWPWGMWKGHDFKDPKTAIGFGRTVIAVDLKSKKMLWDYSVDNYLDARALCMTGDNIFVYSPQNYLGCIDAKTGKPKWQNGDFSLLAAIAPNGKAQHYVTGYATTCYMKSHGDYLFFAGPQRERLVAASADDGTLLWTHPVGNLQLVLRNDAIYAAGPQKTNGVRLDYATGKVLDEFPARRACTRATGSVDSIFYRASGGTVRVLTDTNTAQHIAPMRPPCQDGVLISNGHLYWGPWMCGCQLSLYGNICLGPVQAVDDERAAIYEQSRLVRGDAAEVKPLEIDRRDWPSYRGNNSRNDVTENPIPAKVSLKWKTAVSSNSMPTAPVVAGGLVFVADRTGVVQAWDTDGKLVWKSYTAGPIYYPPAIANDRVFVGSADGRVYAFAAQTGRFLWSYRVADEERLIPVFGKLISSWPLSGGVVVQDDTVYAAAGIAHYDGTHVVALDATTGKPTASNSSSGTLSSQVNSGISVQGNLMIVDGELRFLAGGVYETARYNLKTLECLNSPKVQVTSQFRTAFYPYYPDYGKYVSLEYTCGDGSYLCHDASYEGSVFANISLEAPLPPGVTRDKKEAARWSRRRRGDKKSAPKSLWQDKLNRRFTSFIVSTDDQLIATGHPDDAPEETFLAAINIKKGTDIWLQKLPAETVKGGTAIDHRGRIYVSLENGQLFCFSPEEN